MMEKAHAHQIYWQNTNTISVERDIKFINVFKDINIQPDSEQETPASPQQTPQEPAPLQTPHAMMQPTLQPSQLCRSQCVPKPSQLVQQIAKGEFTNSNYAEADYIADDKHGDFVATLIEEVENDPKSLSEAQARNNWPCWKEAMDAEITTLDRAGTWSNVPQLTHKNIVGSKWVYHIKRKADGTIQKYKACLVARGFTQIYGIDYYHTYSPVARLTTICFLLAMAAWHDWEIDTFDFNGAYLNGELEDGKEIYMRQPPGYETTSGIKRLHKSLYSLKQAGRHWYDTLSHTLADLGFQKIHADLGVFYTCSEETLLILAVHVDDCIITGNSPAGIKDFKKQVHEHYAITDIGPIHWILGIKVTCNRYVRTISLSQDSYANTILTCFNMAGANAVKCPMAPGSIFSKDQCPTDAQEIAHMCKVPHREAIGSLMYLAVAMHPDIAFAITTLSQYLNNLGVSHWEGVKRILRYVCGTTTVKLTYGVEQHNLIGYTASHTNLR